jgi:hypothetical protein
MKYRINDIEIGDEVYFESTSIQSNHDLYWKVIEILPKYDLLIIQLDEMGFNDLRMNLKVKDVYNLIKKAR